MGFTSARPPIDPKYPASPKANTPPSDATNQYPPPSEVAAMPTTGATRCRPPIDPANPAPPKLKTPPSDAVVQYPDRSGGAGGGGGRPAEAEDRRGRRRHGPVWPTRRATTRLPPWVS